jgi:acetyl/propionyl-CoA carboxylase alpha subunit
MKRKWKILPDNEAAVNFNPLYFYFCQMLKIKINGNKEHQLELDSSGKSGLINGEEFSIDLLKTDSRNFHIIRNNKSYNVEVVSEEKAEKTFIIKVNGKKYQLEARDKYDELLKQLGMEAGSAGKINEIKAPMPGLVIDIMVSAGQQVKKGDPIMVLEAMKMENILKSPSDGVVKRIGVEKRQAVEKNQVLVNFE